MDMIFYIISVLKHSLITATLKPPDPNLPIGPFRPFNTFGMLLLDLEPKIFPGTYTHSGKNGKKMHGSTVLIFSAMDGELFCRKNTFTLEYILDLDFLVWIYDFQYLCSQFCFKIKKTASDFNCLNFCCIFLTKLEVLINIFI